MADEAYNSENSDLIVLDTLSDEEAIPTVVVKSDSERNTPNDTSNNAIINHFDSPESPPLHVNNGKPPPLVQLTFRNKQLADHCMKEVEAHIRNVLRQNPSFNHLEHEETQLEIHHEFSLDTQPSVEQDDAMPQEIPLYTISHESFLQDEKEKVDEPESPVVARRKMCCFNCGGEHIVSKCPDQLDYRRIQRNRKSMGSNTTPKSGNSRYHLDGNGLRDASRADFVPGKISQRLEEALGLRSRQLPSYIYRMRVLGYPPGWLKEAEVETSGLTIYDSTGTAVPINQEDGEIEECESRVQHDPNKLVNYVGFNMVLPPDIADEHFKHRMPPFQFHQLRSEAEKTMKTNVVQPFRKRKFPTDVGTSSKDAKVEDMEVEAIEGTIVIESDEEDDCKFIPPLPREAPPPPPQEEEEVEIVDGGPSKSPSLSDLEAAKNKIMKELVEHPAPSTPIPQRAAKSLSVTPGTPVLYEHSTFQSLPESSKFAEGVSDYLPFENLPDSTGVYEKMRGVLTKVRKAYTSL